MDTVARWLLTDTDSGALALGSYTDEPSYEVNLTGWWLAKDGTLDDDEQLRVVRATFLDLDTQETDSVVLYGTTPSYLAVDLEADSDDDATIIEHLASDLASADLSNGLCVGTKHYDEAQVRKLTVS
ncbi:MAG TPA: hypothetical protein VIG46_01300 [Candidatus Baltobacteraceae bacterium]